MNRRRQIQLAIPAAIAFIAYDGLLKCAYKEGGEPEPEETLTRDLLKKASLEPFFYEKDKKKLASLINGADRAARGAMEPYIGSSFGKVFPMVLNVTNRLQDMGYLEVVDGGAYAEAMEAIIDALNTAIDNGEDGASDFEKMLKSADKQADKIITNLQSQGYYQ